MLTSAPGRSAPNRIRKPLGIFKKNLPARVAEAVAAEFQDEMRVGQKKTAWSISAGCERERARANPRSQPLRQRLFVRSDLSSTRYR